MSRIDKFGIAKQSGAGAKQTTMEYWPPIMSVESDHDVQTIEIEENTGVRAPSAIEYGVEFWKVKLKVGAVRYSSLPRLLSMFFGAPVTTTPDVTGAPTGRKHAFSANNSPLHHSLFKVEVDPSPQIIDLFWDVLGDSLTLSVAVNEFVSLEADCVAKELDDTQTTPSATLDTSARIAFDACTVGLSVDGGGEVFAKVDGYELKYENGIDTGEAVLGSRRLYALLAGNSSAEVAFKVKDNALFAAHYRRALLTDPSQVKVRLLAIGAVIGGAVTYQLETILYASEYLEAPANISAADRLKEVAVKARGHYDSGTGKFLEVNVQNIIAAY